MTHSDCPVPVNNLSFSKIVHFGLVKNYVEMKKKTDRQTWHTNFWYRLNASCKWSC